MEHKITLSEQFVLDAEKPNSIGTDELGAYYKVRIKLKQIKDFSFYVDEYLRSDDCTTNDMLCNWLDETYLLNIRSRIKADQLHLVPWEVKIGLVCFMAKDLGYEKSTFLHHLYSKPIAKEFIQRVSDLCPEGFIATLRT